MPFKSKAQAKACFATHGFHGRINCDEWAHATSSMKSLPNKKEMGGKYRGKKKYQLGGCKDALGNVIPCQGQEPQNTSDNGQWMKTSTPNVDAFNQKYASSDMSAYEIHDQQGTPNPFKVVGPSSTQRKEFNYRGLGAAIQGATVGFGFLSGLVERNRQNKYMYDQFSTMGQQNPQSTNDYQPTPYSLYAKYGGSLNKWEEMASGGWIKKASKSIKRRGTEGVCTGSKFGGPSCRPGTRRYALAKTFKKIAKNR